MKHMPYHVQAPNATAVCILRVWLRDVGVKFSLPTDPQHDLVVATADGNKLAVQVRNKQKVLGDGVEVQAKDFTGKNDAVALAAFYFITDAAGYPRRKPSIRDQNVVLNENGNPRKLHYRDEEFLVTIRHNEFRRAPNPNDNVWKQYKTVMEEAVWCFLRGISGSISHHELCIRHGIEVSDLMSYARCYVVNFCGRYETPTPLNCDNERKCYEYIRQRLRYDFLPILWKKERSMTPDAETVRVALFGHADGDFDISPDPTDAYIQAIDNPEAITLGRAILSAPRPQLIFEENTGKRKGRKRRTSQEIQAEMEDEVLDALLGKNNNKTSDVMKALNSFMKGVHIADHKDEQTPSAAIRRRRQASQRLKKLLLDLPHDQLTKKLQEAVDSPILDTQTKREAQRRLSEHVSVCSDCVETQVSDNLGV